MVRLAYAALAAMVFEPCAADILRMMAYEFRYNNRTISEIPLVNWVVPGRTNTEAGATAPRLERDLEDQMPLLRINDYRPTNLGQPLALFHHQATEDIVDYSAWSALGLSGIILHVDRLAVMMNTRPVARNTGRLFAFCALIGLFALLHKSKGHDNESISLLLGGIVALHIYLFVDLILLIRADHLADVTRSVPTRAVHRLNVTFARAAALFRQPTAAEVIEADECAICTADISKGVAVLACGHSFHRVCVLRWAEMPDGGTCPICRTEYAS